jgi:hypothetical protein
MMRNLLSKGGYALRVGTIQGFRKIVGYSRAAAMADRISVAAFAGFNANFPYSVQYR